MQNIEFETDKSYPAGAYTSGEVAREPMMVRWLAKVGITDTSLANYILIGVAGIFLGVTVFLYANVLSEPAKDWSLDARIIMEMQQTR